MLTRMLLRDAEIARLSVDERLALEYVVRTTLSEMARSRRSGDSALLFAIAAAEIWAVLIRSRDDDAVEALVEKVRASRIGRTTLDRVRQVTAVTNAA